MATQNRTIRSGNLVYIYLDGIKVGAAQDATIEFDIAPEPVYGIGDIDPIEHVPTRATYRVSVTQAVLEYNSLLAMGVIPENGDVALIGKVFDFVKVDRLTNKVIRKYVGCSYASGQIATRANGNLTCSGQFVALGAQGTNL
jgi:hypothetical protein